MKLEINGRVVSEQPNWQALDTHMRDLDTKAESTISVSKDLLETLSAVGNLSGGFRAFYTHRANGVEIVSAKSNLRPVVIRRLMGDFIDNKRGWHGGIGWTSAADPVAEESLLSKLFHRYALSFIVTVVGVLILPLVTFLGAGILIYAPMCAQLNTESIHFTFVDHRSILSRNPNAYQPPSCQYDNGASVPLARVAGDYTGTLDMLLNLLVIAEIVVTLVIANWLRHRGPGTSLTKAARSTS